MLLPLLLIVVVMVFMTRSQKKRQQAAVDMRNQMQEGSGVRTIGGMYATVKGVGDDAVLLEVAPGIHATYAKTAIATVLDDEEYARITEGAAGLPEGFTTDDVPDDASSLDEYNYEDENEDEPRAEVEGDEESDKVDMTKDSDHEDEADEEHEPEDEHSDAAPKADLRKDGDSK
ncbi:preprotein translocase subunit YajC [Mangrovactinospora gilvigrisea]|uniref:Preprotein translocase subunit YajC n=1 Tax=Mangrovactinospora gilvigrisea TaxID=1428644 RepID=A0A1J7C049_9ACTN|nr:preprotein translocase subunit YajC [Mangrovactinospora gilvigrisea]OIV39105.1 preprotein translocase subunit YajC [Mangrovactinospora gilvigrisea]